jgi:SAM-dependent methyltransferase
MTHNISVDPETLRADVRDKYKDVATNPHGTFHFHTGRPLAALLGYDPAVVDALPDEAVESFAGVGNPHSLRPPVAGDHVLDLGSGGGFDCFVAAQAVGPHGAVIGVDMTPEMLTKSRNTAAELGLGHVEFWTGILEELPVDDGWADIRPSWMPPPTGSGSPCRCASTTPTSRSSRRYPSSAISRLSDSRPPGGPRQPEDAGCARLGRCHRSSV